jgi:hypothetical protein
MNKSVNKILKDIEKTLYLIYKNIPPNKIIKCYFGEIRTDYLGNPIEIEFKKKYFDIIRNNSILTFGPNFYSKNKIGTIYGIKVLIDNNLKEEDLK